MTTTCLTVAGVIAALVVAASIIDGRCGLLAKKCASPTPLLNSPKSGDRMLARRWAPTA
jgi:hypothetical protein